MKNRNDPRGCSCHGFTFTRDRDLGYCVTAAIIITIIIRLYVIENILFNFLLIIMRVEIF